MPILLLSSAVDETNEGEAGDENISILAELCLTNASGEEDNLTELHL